MQQGSKICQNCKSQFIIDASDLDFYKKISVPPPTWCPECRMRRRMAHRNERRLYKSKCGLCARDGISMYSPESPYTAYCPDCWWSDKWNPLSYGLELDLSKSFWKQLEKLLLVIPRESLYQVQMVQSTYCNNGFAFKNCYFTFSGHHYEDCAFSEHSGYLKNCFDVGFSRNTELSYQSINIINCFKVFF